MEYIYFKVIFSPVEDKLIQGCKVLDIGCGAATWLLDLSNKYENSYFYGVDIKPIYPQVIKPHNLEFIEADWDFIPSELVRVTKPGGCIEVAGRRNDYVGDGSIFRKLTDAIWSTYLIQNIDVKLAYNLDSKFELQPNVGEVHRIEKDFILELRTKVLNEELGISEEEHKNMVENLVDEFKLTSAECVHFRFWTKKQLLE
ncbi:unnamed protein product [Rhizophagus irregularis]|nr:unnamed protein product [Rhizophagus irregularis]